MAVWVGVPRCGMSAMGGGGGGGADGGGPIVPVTQKSTYGIYWYDPVA